MGVDSPIPELLDVHEIAQRIGCGVGAVRLAIANKELKCRRIGKKFRSTPEEVAEWIQRTGGYKSAEDGLETARKPGQRRGKSSLRVAKSA